MQTRKPKPTFRRPLGADLKGVFVALSKAAISAKAGKWDAAAKGLLDMVAHIRFKAEPEELAYSLLLSGLSEALRELVSGAEKLMNQKREPVALEGLLGKLDGTLEVVLDESFFQDPSTLEVLQEVKPVLSRFLELHGVKKSSSSVIADRLPAYFTSAVVEEWVAEPDRYQPVLRAIAHPFASAERELLDWKRYSAHLQRVTFESILGEPFGLAQVYVPLAAYYRGDTPAGTATKTGEPTKTQRVVVELEDELVDWYNSATRRTAIRLLTGGPGSGKSSSARMIASTLADKDCRVLYVPLHLIRVRGELVEEVGAFLKDQGHFFRNPIRRASKVNRTLLIFDGLDELAGVGIPGANEAADFAHQVDVWLNRVNRDGDVRLLALIVGRELAIEACETRFRARGSVLRMLRYREPQSESLNYHDPSGILKTDRRKQWWAQYATLTGRKKSNIEGLPQSLRKPELEELTLEPLLNHLLGIAWEADFRALGGVTSRNEVYGHLLGAVYSRGWEDHSHPSFGQLSGVEEFTRLLEEIALAVWHGKGNSTTMDAILAHPSTTYLKRSVEALKSGAEQGLLSLLTAFYFRRQDRNVNNEARFEFTHRSFGEYLTARRVVRGIQLIDSMMRSPNPESAWDLTDALAYWLNLTGGARLHLDLEKFLHEEIGLYRVEEVTAWQETLQELFTAVLATGVPVRRQEQRKHLREEARYARNSEEALLCSLCYCALKTEKTSAIEHRTRTSFGRWLRWVQGQRSSSSNPPTLRALSHLRLEGVGLALADLFGARLAGSQLAGADLTYANLNLADLTGAKLTHADLDDAALMGTCLRGADLSHSTLKRTSLRRAWLEGASLIGARLDRADLTGADLRGADLRRAKLIGANLGSPQEGTLVNLEHADIRGADFSGVTFGLWDGTAQQPLNWHQVFGASISDHDTTFPAGSGAP